MQLLGSIIYLTSAFYSFEGVGLLSTLDSLLLCAFMITRFSVFYKMGCYIRK